MRNLTSENFKSAISGKKPVLVDFWADWCGSCRMMTPQLAILDCELGGRLDICRVNVDRESALALAHGVESIPTMVLFERGAERKRIVGFRGVGDIRDELGI